MAQNAYQPYSPYQQPQYGPYQNMYAWPGQPVQEQNCIVPEWTEGVKRKKGELVAWDGTVYRVIGNVNKNKAERPGEDGGRYYQPVPKPEEPAASGE